MKNSIICILIVLLVSSCSVTKFYNEYSDEEKELQKELLLKKDQLHKMKTLGDDLRNIKYNGFAYYEDNEIDQIAFKKYKEGIQAGECLVFNKGSDGKYFLSAFLKPKMPNDMLIKMYLPDGRIYYKLTYSGKIYMMNKDFELNLIKNFKNNRDARRYFFNEGKILNLKLKKLNQKLKESGKVHFSEKFMETLSNERQYNN